MEQALKTIELVEAILSQLPMRDLLLAQRVCKHWKEVIDASSKLQKALFFQPATDRVAFHHTQNRISWWWKNVDELQSADFFYLCKAADVDTAVAFERTRRYASSFPSVHALSTADKMAATVKRRHERLQQLERDIDRNTTKTRVFLNPLLLATFDWVGDFFNSKPIQLPFERRHRPEASWRRMLVTQPPLGAVQGKVRGDDRWNCFGYAHIGTAVTMGALESTVRNVSFKYRADTSGLEIEGLDNFEIWEDVTDLAKIGVGVRPDSLVEAMEKVDLADDGLLL
ncbi:hypothetical protein LTR37_020111 [Vermiconidia calcicola]|uniref:Uncharacterized protein n=1 Tax=Vermiconidia calcicola TaxID=1690605 RepID=A0ACC3ME78_9PEZI|nr:hypothetical protein LTR37_020111 [Vermiconidia calcicola]